MKLTPERRLLLACARSRPIAEEMQRIKDAAAENLDWNTLAAVSCAHGIAPLIYNSLRSSCALPLVPAPAAKVLRDSYYFNGARNALILAELHRILKALEEAHVGVMALKGAALAEIVYCNAALRPMLDIDLLVREPLLGDVERVLAEMGYQLSLAEGTRAYYMENHYHFVFQKEANAEVEIHWNLKRPAHSFRIDIEAIWERARIATFGGNHALVLAPEDCLLYLCLHFWKHKLLGGVRPLCDIAEAVTFYSDGIDWIKLLTISGEWQMNPCSYLVLRLARELLDARIPERLLKDLQPPDFDEEIVNCAAETVIGYGECPRVSSDLLTLFWKSVPFKERWTVLCKALSRKTVAGYGNASSAAEGRLFYASRIRHLMTHYGPTVALLWTGDRRMRAAAETRRKQELLLASLFNTADRNIS